MNIMPAMNNQLLEDSLVKLCFPNTAHCVLEMDRTLGFSVGRIVDTQDESIAVLGLLQGTEYQLIWRNRQHASGQWKVGRVFSANRKQRQVKIFAYLIYGPKIIEFHCSMREYRVPKRVRSQTLCIRCFIVPACLSAGTRDEILSREQPDAPKQGQRNCSFPVQFQFIFRQSIREERQRVCVVFHGHE